MSINRQKSCKYNPRHQEIHWKGKILLVRDKYVYGFLTAREENRGAVTRYRYVPLQKKLQKNCRAFLRPTLGNKVNIEG